MSPSRCRRGIRFSLNRKVLNAFVVWEWATVSRQIFVGVPAHLVPDVLDGLEAGPLVARVHQVAGPEGEVLQQLALGRVQGGDGAPQREVAEVHVAALVLEDVVEDLARVGSPVCLRMRLKAAMASPSMIICMPRSFSSQRFVARISSMQRLEERIDRVDLVELLDVPLEDLDVAALVHHLGGGVELGVELGESS